jgi:hypothetical protein
MGQYCFVSDIHNRNTRQVLNLNIYQPSIHLSIYKKGHIICASNYSLSTIKFEKIIKDVKRFKLKLGEFLSRHSFYTLDEYIEYSSWKD